MIKEDLHIIASVNDHWVVILRPLVEFVIMCLVAALFLIAAEWLNHTPYFSHFLFLFAIAVLSFEIHRLFTRLIEWEISSWIISTEYVIDFEKSFYRMSDAMYINIDKIDEIERKKHGFWANLLDYGDIHINVAASPISIVCRDIPNPGRWAEVIKALQKGVVEPLPEKLARYAIPVGWRLRNQQHS